MRLAPVEHPTNPLIRLAYYFSRRQLGKVVTPLRVFYARKPRLLALASHVAWTMEHGLSIDPEIRFLVLAQAARLNGCAFCHDLALASAIRARVGTERFAALAEYRTSSLFSERERAALAMSEEATMDRRVSDATWTALRAHFSETEIVELIWVNAAENYFNLQATAMGFESEGFAAMAAGR
ncbi:MAG TPA: carboxymuconolactone decarboxylase family protein [Longimicrobium sp.]|nr:carboxymuconolactone decarboxylase family protein [Longimicrobium sp.]